ncbi:DNA polymerase [Acidicapsa dinghuensis]|uniref:DNA polymerase n=1 Tax=Acidicapsa dinghuensis TaxID=2218256 RepID=A0ABW1EEP1_9BACT|nr:DNA polymerase [Acidicapsa dinghuensis]
MATFAHPVPPPATRRLVTQQPEVNWLFLDLNSYFASVEQEVRPELRNRPVAVVPSLVDTTCCIAASYEAKAFGVKTGTMVKEARELCPNIIFVEGRHELYTEYHKKIVAAVWTCIPVTSIRSIDEMVCQLIGQERPLLAAMDLAKRIKQAIREQVGSTLRCSIGLATNQYLAKVATDMDKPDGLIALTKDILPQALPTLELRDLPGVGARMEKRLNDKGIHTMTDLLAVLERDHGREQAGELWGSVWGERMWHWLRGDDLVEEDRECAKSMGHQHVLAPIFRTPEGAWAVAHKLLHKAAMRMRGDNLWASRISLTIAFQGRTRMKGSSPFGPGRSESWSAEMRLLECQDNPTLIGALLRLWNSRPKDREHQQPFFVSVTLSDLVPDELHSLTLFDSQDGTSERLRLAAAMDTLNHKYGMSTLAPAVMLKAFEAAPTRIAFRSVPEIFDHSKKGISLRL